MTRFLPGGLQLHSRQLKYANCCRAAPHFAVEIRQKATPPQKRTSARRNKKRGIFPRPFFFSSSSFQVLGFHHSGKQSVQRSKKVVPVETGWEP
jgi:hypothetical protein